jgi:hypothetical protein
MQNADRRLILEVGFLLRKLCFQETSCGRSLNLYALQRFHSCSTGNHARTPFCTPAIEKEKQSSNWNKPSAAIDPYCFYHTSTHPCQGQFDRQGPSRSSGAHQHGDASAAQKHWPPTPVHWIEQHSPSWLLPYVHLARYHKPIGSWLLAWPCLWSIALATPQGTTPDIYLLILFGTGSLVRMHA